MGDLKRKQVFVAKLNFIETADKFQLRSILDKMHSTYLTLYRIQRWISIFRKRKRVSEELKS